MGIVPLQGFLDAIVYGLSTSELSLLREKLIQRQKAKGKFVEPAPVVEQPKKKINKDTVITVVAFILLILIRGSLNLIISYGTDISPPVSVHYERTD
jgi:hypothetical protein